MGDVEKYYANMQHMASFILHIRNKEDTKNSRRGSGADGVPAYGRKNAPQARGGKRRFQQSKGWWRKSLVTETIASNAMEDEMETAYVSPRVREVVKLTKD